jgi:hypothetical protein
VRLKLIFMMMFLLGASQGFGLNVKVAQILDAPESAVGRAFGYSDWLGYLDNGTLLYKGSLPPNLYAVGGDKYMKLIEQYKNPIFETQKPNRVVTELLPSRVNGEFLYYARTGGAEQECYRVMPQPEDGASVELVDKEYWTKNVDRITRADYSLKNGYLLDLQESGTGDLNPAIRKSESGPAFVLNNRFRLANILHFGRIAISPDKSQIAMIVTYLPEESDRWTDRLVILELDYSESSK